MKQKQSSIYREQTGGCWGEGFGGMGKMDEGEWEVQISNSGMKKSQEWKVKKKKGGENEK